MSTELHDWLMGLIGRALHVEKTLAEKPYQKSIDHISRLDELRNHRLQAEELIRCTNRVDHKRESSYDSIFYEVATNLEHEIEACERCIPAENADQL
jgi:hypothetical protein